MAVFLVPHRLYSFKRIVFTFSLPLLLFSSANAQQAAPPGWIDQVDYVSSQSPSSTAPTKTDSNAFESLEKRIESAAELSDEEKAEWSKRLTSARDSLKNEAESSSLQIRLSNEVRDAPETIARLKETLSKGSRERSAELPATTLSDLESKITELELLSTTTKEHLDRLEKQTNGRAQRLTEIGKEIAEVEELLASADAIDTDASPLKVEIQKLESDARRRALNARFSLLKTENQHLQTLGEQWLLEHDVAVRKLNATESELKELRQVKEAWRRNEANRNAAEARQLAEQIHPAIRFLAIRNLEIADRRVETAETAEKASNELSKLTEGLNRLEGKLESLQSKVQHAPNATSTGILLRQQRSDLPIVNACVARAEWLADVTPKAHLTRTDLKEERRRVADPKAFAENTIATNKKLQTYDRSQVVQAISTLAEKRRELLGKLIADQDTLLSDLSEVEVANQDMVKKITSLQTFLDEHVLWVRSDNVLSLADVRAAGAAATSLLDKSLWQKAIESVVGETYRRPMVLLTVGLLTLLAFVFRQRLARRLDKLCAPVKPLQKLPFGMSLQGLAITALMSAGWPMILLAIGYKLITSADSDEYAIGLGRGLFATAIFVWGCHFVREVCTENRVGHRMFNWPAAVLLSIRRTLELTVMFAAPLVALLFVSAHAPVDGHASLHRITLISILAFVSLQCFLLLRPGSAIMQANQRLRRDSLVAKLQKPIWLAAIAAPLALAAVSISGFHYSAMVLVGRFAESTLVILGLILMHALVLRWLRIKSFNLQVETHTPEENSGRDEDSTDVPWEESVNDDILELLRYATVMSLLIGGWFIWAEVLPALGVLDRIVLWDNFIEKSEFVTDPTGNQSVQRYEVNNPTTLMDGICALLVFVTTLVVVRRLANLLEFTVLTRLSIDRGGRHAVAIMVNYVATLAGLLIACMILQLSWGNVQWLAAAMTVGLGFGLQEIFANLVSGLIILFERPIRAGDVITVGDITGTVSRMKMRATTIMDFDRRELIVPNRKFITDNVVNWTLSDPICRTIIKVGVAYGSDTQLVRETLLSIAQRCPLVLDSPAATVGFCSFGDSTLDFELRAFIAHRENKPEVDNELNTMIDRAFTKANIEIAFPQQDLRIRSITDVALPVAKAA